MNQSTKTRVRTSKEIGTIQADQSMPIKPKSLMNLNTQHDQFTGNHTSIRAYLASRSQSAKAGACTFLQKGTQEMKQTIYGLIRSDNRYYYAIGNQALVVQVEPFPVAWRKTPSTSWKQRTVNFNFFDLTCLASEF